MFQGYFVYNGNVYPSGTIVKIQLKNDVLKTVTEEKMIFCSISGNNIYGCREIAIKRVHFFSEDQFFASLIEVTEQIDSSFTDAEKQKQIRLDKYNKKPTFKEQMNVDGLGLAWVWYIFIMTVAIIFNDRVGIWLLASVIFFNYRRKKLREEGYKL